MPTKHLRFGLRARDAVAWASAVLILSGLLLTLDGLTGPYIRISTVFVLPVAVVAYRWGWPAAVALGLLVGLSRLWLVADSESPWLVLPEIANLGLSITVFLFVAFGVHHLRVSRSRAHPPHPTLPVCGGCGRVKNPTGRWVRFERLVSTVTAADFRHTVCPECEQRFRAPEVIYPGQAR
ncbi:MAG TPA: hypothetical protein VLB12_13385 [Gemmatimonadales bacterium]|nr:hypothetical protein [Gemmatimonadales bacterium]